MLLSTNQIVMDLLHISEKHGAICKNYKLLTVNLEPLLLYQKTVYRVGNKTGRRAR